VATQNFLIEPSIATDDVIVWAWAILDVGLNILNCSHQKPIRAYQIISGARAVLDVT
jgi:hypothetical protein